jgi:hypothetical protein
MKRWLKGALGAAAMLGAPATAQAARLLTFTFGANGTGIWQGMDPVSSDQFSRPVSGATLSFGVLVDDNGTGGAGGGPNGGYGVGATTQGVAFSSRGGGGYAGLTSTGLACFANPGSTLPLGRVTVDPSCGSVTFRQQYRYSFIEFSGVVDQLTISEGGTFGDASVVAFVPEPASWALMLTGFAITGAALRRRRARIAFAA